MKYQAMKTCINIKRSEFNCNDKDDIKIVYDIVNEVYKSADPLTETLFETSDAALDYLKKSGEASKVVRDDEYVHIIAVWVEALDSNNEPLMSMIIYDD